MKGKWIVTDPDTNQEMLQLSGNKFLFKEDRLDPETREIFVYESTIDLSEYTREQMFEDVESFGYSFHEMCNWIDSGESVSLIAECIFEMEGI